MAWILCPADKAGLPSATGPRGASAGGKRGLPGSRLCFSTHVPPSQNHSSFFQSLSLLICKMETACPSCKVILRLRDDAGKAPGLLQVLSMREIRSVFPALGSCDLRYLVEGRRVKAVRKFHDAIWDIHSCELATLFFLELIRDRHR